MDQEVYDIQEEGGSSYVTRPVSIFMLLMDHVGRGQGFQHLGDSYNCYALLSVVTLGIQDSAVPSGSTSISQSLPLLNQQFHQYVWGQSTKIKKQLSRSGLLKLAVWCASVWLISQLRVPERLSFQTLTQWSWGSRPHEKINLTSFYL